MRLGSCVIVGALILVTASHSESQQLLRAEPAKMQSIAARDAIQPLPPAIEKHAAVLRNRLRPSVQSWIAQQAQAVAAQPDPNIPALRTSIRQRFNESLAPTDAKAGGSLVGGASTLDDALAFLILMQAAQNDESDLRSQMQQVQTINQQKQALRQIQDDINQQTRAIAPTLRMRPCSTPVCRALPSRLTAVNEATAGLAKPTHLQAGSNLTYQQLDTILSDLKPSLDSMSEMSEMASMRLQMAMDRRSKFIETLSNIEKSINDTQSSIIGNLK